MEEADMAHRSAGGNRRGGSRRGRPWIGNPGGLLLIILILGCSGSRKVLPAQSEFVIGTVCAINLYNQGTEKLYRRIFDRLRAIEDLMSANKAGTEIDLINQNAGIKPVKVHQEVIEVIDAALTYAERSDGAFDPTVGPLVKLWDIGSEHARVPTEAEIQEALALINWRDLILDREAETVFLRRPGMSIDLGAIAKGYAADEIVGILKKTGITGAIIDLGGNVYAFGEKEGRLPWRVGVQNPLEPRGAYLGVLELRNKTIVTSGVYERYFEADGKRYHHILSSVNGYPVESGLLSVTIVADRSIDGDGLSTTCFAMGYAQSLSLLETLPGVEAIFVFEDQGVWITPGLSGYFSLTNEEYTLFY